jgi:hypothetical protein
MDTNGGLRGMTPKDVARELLRGSYRATSILAGAVIVQITALAWLMISLAHDTGMDVTTIPAVSWCIGFAVLATAVATAAARLLLGRHLSALMTVAVLAGWRAGHRDNRAHHFDDAGRGHLLRAARRAGQPRLVRDRGLVHRPVGSSARRNGPALQSAHANVDPSRAGYGEALGQVDACAGKARNHNELQLPYQSCASRASRPR